MDLEDAKLRFKNAEFFVCNVLCAEPVNPMKEVPYTEGFKWQDYMLKDLELLAKCDTIYMLKNWYDSKGARIEFDFAVAMGVRIIYEYQDDYFKK